MQKLCQILEAPLVTLNAQEAGPEREQDLQEWGGDAAEADGIGAVQAQEAVSRGSPIQQELEYLSWERVSQEEEDEEAEEEEEVVVLVVGQEGVDDGTREELEERNVH